MKALTFFFMLLLSASHLHAQTITGFTVIPSNPTINDTVTIYIQCDFTSSGCEGSAIMNGITGNQIDAGAIHCVGNLGALCTDIDTLIIPPLPAGSYTLTYTLVTGITVGCIPNIVPIDVDGTSFTVTTVTSSDDLVKQRIVVSPNPSDGKISINKPVRGTAFVKLYSMEGKPLETIRLTESSTNIDLALPAGIYLAKIEESNNITVSTIIIR